MNARLISERVNKFLLTARHSKEWINTTTFFRKLFKQNKIYVSIPIERYLK